MKKYYRVKIGYGKDDFISIDESDLQKAIKVQISGKVALFKEGTISGNHIIAIVPDYNRMLGVNRDYQLTGEDYDRLGPKVLTDCSRLLETTKAEVEAQLTGRPVLALTN
jgi:hypothetical protein